MKFGIEHGIRLTLDALPDLFDLAPSKDYVVSRPQGTSPRALSHKSWIATERQLAESTYEFATTDEKYVGYKRR